MPHQLARRFTCIALMLCAGAASAQWLYGGPFWRHVQVPWMFNGTVAAADTAGWIVVVDASPAQSGSFRSSDDGMTWNAVSGPPGTWPGLEYLLADGDGNLYAYSQQGLYRSSDHGTQWDSLPIDRAHPYLGFLTLSNAGRSGLIGLAYDGGRARVMRSSDHGDHWTTIDTVLCRTVYLKSVFARDGDTVIAGGSDGRVFRSDDGGATWDTVSAGAMHGSVWTIRALPGGRMIAFGDSGAFVGSADGRVWSRTAELSGRYSLHEQPVLANGPGSELYLAGPDGVFLSVDSGGTCIGMRRKRMTMDILRARRPMREAAAPRTGTRSSMDDTM